MKTGPLKSPITWGLLIVGMLALSGFQQPDTRQLTRVVLTFPTGELFLHVDRDSAQLGYGALSPVPVVHDGRLNMAELLQQLQPWLEEVVPTDEIPAGEEYGMARLLYSDGTKEAYLVFDADLAGELFGLACANIVGDASAPEPFNNPAARDIVLRACAESGNDESER